MASASLLKAAVGQLGENRHYLPASMTYPLLLLRCDLRGNHPRGKCIYVVGSNQHQAYSEQGVEKGARRSLVAGRWDEVRVDVAGDAGQVFNSRQGVDVGDR